MNDQDQKTVSKADHDLALKICHEGSLSDHDSTILNQIASARACADPVDIEVYKEFRGLVLQYQAGIIYAKDTTTLYIEQATRALAFQSEIMGAFPDPLILAEPKSQAQKEGLDLFLAQLEDAGATVTLQLE